MIYAANARQDSANAFSDSGFAKDIERRVRIACSNGEFRVCYSFNDEVEDDFVRDACRFLEVYGYSVMWLNKQEEIVISW